MLLYSAAGKSGTFHAEIVLSAMANEYYDHVQARWALQINDPRFVLDEYKEFENFCWLRREGLKMKNEATRALELTWTDLMAWAVLAGHHEVATALWRKTELPLRAALMASQMCRRLAGEWGGQGGRR